jgi:bifunctional non-homologous end joining protein LigD
MSTLREYNRKRDFKKTAEPAGKVARGKGLNRFVIQKHDASRLHYDFRLEMSGTLKSWAVPKGLPYAHGEKHLAVHVEDHPLDYIDFEGTIPEGEYGGGTVMVWDRGTYEPLSKAPTKELAGGKLHFVLHGEKLQGEWYLVQMHGRGEDDNQWLIIRGGEDFKPLSKKADDTSVLSGKSMKALATGDGRVWHSEPEKAAKPQSKVKPLPVPKFVEPMAAKLVAEAPKTGDWLYEIKFDGWRALALRGTEEAQLISRNNKDFSRKFPALRDAVLALPVRDAILDGEIVAQDPRGRSSFQLLQAYDLGQEKPPLFYYVFDLLRLDGEDLRGLPLTERRRRLEALLGSDPPEGIRYSAPLGGDPAPLLKQARKHGIEGLIGKRADSLYETGRRSGAWIKLKILAEQEFVIGGFTPPEGTRKHFGALILGVYQGKDLIYVGKVGTGFSTKLLKELHGRMLPLKRETCPFVNLPEPRGHRYSQGITNAEMGKCTWLTPKLVGQVKFSEWTADARLRQPVFLGLREDKSAREVTRESASG